MGVFSWDDWRQRLALAGLLVIVSLQLMPLTSYAQNLGQQPATGQAVQGQTAAQPEGAVLNLVNCNGPACYAPALGIGHDRPSAPRSLSYWRSWPIPRAGA